MLVKNVDLDCSLALLDKTIKAGNCSGAPDSHEAPKATHCLSGNEFVAT